MTSPTGLAFSADGTKMFVMGFTGGDVNEYALSSAFSITLTGTPPDLAPTFSSATLDRGTGVLEITFSEAIDATPPANIDPTKFHVREKSTATGGVTLSAAQLGTNADSATITFTLNAANLAAVNALDSPELTIDPAAVLDTGGSGFGATFDISTAAFADSFSVGTQDTQPVGLAFSDDGTRMFVVGFDENDVNEYALSTAFDISTAAFTDSFSVGAQDTRPYGLAFSDDGAKMFVVGGDGDDVNEYALSTAFDVSTAAFTDSFSVSAQDTRPTGLAFSADGAKMFVTGFNGDGVNEYALSTAFDVSTADFTDAFSVSAQDTQPVGLAFSADGTRMFVVGFDENDVNEYALSTAFDVSTAAFTDSFSVGAQDTIPTGLAFSDDGAKMFVVGFTGDDVNEYALSTAFDVSTAAFTDSFSVSAQDTSPYGLAFSADGAKMFVVGNSGDDVNEYALSTAFDVSTAAFVTDSFSVSAQDTRPYGLAFSADGTKMFVVGLVRASVNEYALSTAFDVSTAAFTDSFSVGAQDTRPTGLAFSDDGTKMFVVGFTGEDVNEYALSTAFDVSTAAFTDSFSVGAQDTSPAGLAFSDDGAKMFVVGNTGDDVNEYALSTAFDVSTAAFTDSFSVGAQDTRPTGLAFSDDGAKMFVVGFTGNDVNEYALSSAFSITLTGTPPDLAPTFSSATLDRGTGVLEITFSEAIDATPPANIDPTKFHVREAGTATGGVVTLSAAQLGTNADSATITFTLNAANLAAVNALDSPELTIDPAAVRDTGGNVFGATFDVSTAAFTDSFSVGAQDDSPAGLAFSDDGAKMFVVGNTRDDVNEYALSTAFDISTAAFTDSFSVGAQDTSPYGLAFSDDGAKMFVVGNTGDGVNEYALSTAFDISTAAFTDSFSVGAQDTRPYGLAFSADGAKMFVVGNGGDDVNEYALSTAFDVSTAAFTDSFSVSAQDARPAGLTFSADGAKMFVVGFTGGDVNEYALSTAFDVSTAAFTDSFLVSAQDTSPTGLAFSADGAKMFVTGFDGNDVNEYALSSAFSITLTGMVEAAPPTNSPPVADAGDDQIVAEGSTVNLSGMASDADPEDSLTPSWTHNSTLTITLTDGGALTPSFTAPNVPVDTVVEFTLTVQDGTATVSDTMLVTITDSENAVPTVNAGPDQEVAEGSTVNLDGTAADTDPEDALTYGWSHNSTLAISLSSDSVLDPSFTAPNVDSDTVVEFTLTVQDGTATVSDTMLVTINAPPTFSSAALDRGTGVLEITFSEAIDATPPANIDPAKFHVREKSTATGGVTLSAAQLGTNADSATITFTLNAANLAAVNALDSPELTIDPAAVRDTGGSGFGATFDVSTAAFTDSFSVGAQDASPAGLAFSADGTKMFVVGVIRDDVHEYALSTAFDVSTAAFTDSFSVGAQDVSPAGLAFSDDGAKMFVAGNAGDGVHEYALSTAFDVSTAAFTDSFSVGAQDTFPIGLAFSDDGAKMFVVGNTGDNVNEYALSTAFDVSTAAFTDSFSVGAQDISPTGLAFSDDGAKMFVVGNDGNDVNEYALSTAFDVSTAAFTDSFSVGAQDTRPAGLAFSDDGAKMFVTGFVGNDVNEYALSSAFSITLTGMVEAAPPTNSPPAVNAGDDQTVAEGSTVNLDGTAMDADLEDTLTYSWSHNSTLTITLTDGGALTPSFTAPNVPEDTTVEFTLSVSDGTASVSDTVDVTITDSANSPPVADAGDDQTVAEGSTVNLSGMASDADPEDSLTPSWTHNSTLTITLTDGGALTPSFTAPNVPEDTTVEFTLSVSDGTASVSDTVDVTITDSANSPPAVNAGDDQTVAEGSTVNLDGTAMDADLEDTLTYSWSHNSTLTITLTDGGAILDPSFAAPNVPEDTTVEFTLSVSDGTASVSDTVDVTITDSANSPPAVNAGDDQTVAEGSTVNLDGTAMDADLEDTLTYSWSHNSTLTITLTDGGALTPSFTAPNVPEDTTVEFTLSVSDGTASVSDTVDVTITDSANSPPAVNAGDDQTVAEGSTVNLDGTAMDADLEDTLTYSWSHNSTLTITLTDGGALTPSFTAPNVPEDTTVEFTLSVSDGTASVSDTVDVTITDSANSPPAVNAGDDQTVAEGSTVNLDGTAMDADLEDTLTYSWSHNSTLTITLTDGGALTPSFTAPNVPEDTTVEFTLSVSDGTASVSDTVDVTITDSANSPPVADAGDDQTVAEGSTVNLSGMASDADPEDSLTPSWTTTPPSP